CGGPVLQGYSDDLGSTQNLKNSVLTGQTVNVTGEATLVSVGIIAHPPGNSAQRTRISVGVYTDAGGLPGALIAKAEGQPIVNGRNDYRVSPAPGRSLDLPVGRYWLVAGTTDPVRIAGSAAAVEEQVTADVVADGTLPPALTGVTSDK